VAPLVATVSRPAVRPVAAAPPRELRSGSDAGFHACLRRQCRASRREVASCPGTSAGDLAPVVADRIPLLEAESAHRLLEAGRYAGKVVPAPG
jgi:hypothetical protein